MSTQTPSGQQQLTRLTVNAKRAKGAPPKTIPADLPAPNNVRKYIVGSFNAHGNAWVHVPPIEGVVAASGVFATATETHEYPPGSGRYGVPKIGDCRNIQVRNIAPNDDGSIDMIIFIDWGDDIPIGVQLLVVNEYN